MSAFDPRPDKPAAKALRPKRAATLILLRGPSDRPEVLMGRRAAGHIFMPNRWVFPGGRVDRSDYNVPVVDGLDQTTTHALRSSLTPAQAEAAAKAAIRETFEETGIRLSSASPSPCPYSGRDPVWKAFCAKNTAPRLKPLSILARAITPPGRPRRFDAFFFVANAERFDTSLTPRASEELDEVAWVAMSETRELRTASITRFVLGHLESQVLRPPDEREALFIREQRGGMRVSPLATGAGSEDSTA